MYDRISNKKKQIFCGICVFSIHFQELTNKSCKHILNSALKHHTYNIHKIWNEQITFIEDNESLFVSSLSSGKHVREVYTPLNPTFIL